MTVITRRRFLEVSSVTLAATALMGAKVAGETSKPNFLFIMVDDMPKWMLEHMPIASAGIDSAGLTFENFYGAQPLCSPNRASFLTGLYPHNHTIIDNTGAAAKFHQKGLDKNTIATSLKGAGYRNGLVGKYFNGLQATTEKNYVPPGWDYFVGLASDSYLTIRADINGKWTDTGVSVTQEARWLADHVVNFVGGTEPWFCFYGPRAPHTPLTPSAASEHYADNIPLRRPVNFNEPDGMADKPTGVGLRRNALTTGEIAELETMQEGMLEELQDVDAQVGRLLDTLAARGQLANTYVFFTSDNGFMLGENRQRAKNWAYQESAELPLLLRGPGVGAGSTNNLTSIVDIRATLENLAGSAGDVGYNGRSLAPLFSSTPSTWRKRLLFERPPVGTNPGWYALHEPPYIYVEWTTQGKELYDLATDPGELQSQHATKPSLVNQFSTRLASMKTARGDALRAAEVA
jgi:arylsulfatase A-like enzyme